ncbi:thioredoxin-dependent thiol peroxidase [Raineyella fluvialis]|uniref:thioredoxin-dependent peroxiredoxin n=1 Tax=Raineyella fluvialis TaxID=2662261 RepID=A0A5Q2F657_9ACTN|nr:thioredoxin-dependent thiol peroxidase [Raineyella fluvialis]QGF22452.1 thioredoxin-dependent thiol peroxidase [Raineyella fluvialis]
MQNQLEKGAVAPAFTLLDADGTSVSLSDFAGKRVIVYFYPAAMTPGCTTEACDFTTYRPDLETAGVAAILGISPDRPEQLAKFRDKESLSVTLLSDRDRTTLEAYGAYGEKMNYGKTIMGVIRSTFTVDVDDKGVGHIADAKYNVKAKGHVERILKELQV